MSENTFELHDVELRIFPDGSIGDKRNKIWDLAMVMG